MFFLALNEKNAMQTIGCIALYGRCNRYMFTPFVWHIRLDEQRLISLRRLLQEALRCDTLRQHRRVLPTF